MFTFSTSTNPAADIAAVATSNVASFASVAILIAGVILALYVLERVIDAISGRSGGNVV